MLRLIGRFALPSFVCLLLSVSDALSDVKPPMLHYRSGGSVFPVFAFPIGNSQVVIFGGSELQTDMGIVLATDVELYDYRGAGRALTSLPFNVSTAAQLSDGSVMACGGALSQLSSDCSIYRSAGDQWQPLDRPEQVGLIPNLVPLPGGSALVGGGFTPAGPAGRIYSRVFYVLDPSSLRWRRVADAPSDLGAATGVPMTDGRAFFAGGQSSWTVRIFDPAVGQWSVPASIPNVSLSRSLLPLPGNKVLLLNTGTSPVSQIYDATRDAWSTAPDLQYTADGFTMNVLPNGQVLIAGGTQTQPDTRIVVAKTLLFDPQSGAVRLGAPMEVPRSGHATIVLPDGQVLFLGGTTQFYPYQIVLGSFAPPSLTNSVESFPWEPAIRATLDPGYYVATVTQTPFGRGGLWGIEALILVGPRRAGGTLAGGLNFGGFLDWKDIEAGFGGFYIDYPQTVSATANVQLNSSAHPGTGGPLLANVRILDAAKNVVAGPVEGEGRVALEKALQPGFYSVEIHSDRDQSSPAAFQIALAATEMKFGGSAGSLISRNAGVSGFLGFYLSTPEEVAITLFNQNTYGSPRGAGEVILGLRDSSGKVLFQSGPGTMK